MKRTGVVRAEQSETQVTTEAVGGHEEADKDEEIKAQEHEENEEQKEEYSHWERENDIKPALVEGVSFDQVFKWCTSSFFALPSFSFFLFACVAVVSCSSAHATPAFPLWAGTPWRTYASSSASRASQRPARRWSWCST
jgi:hypothetical protein